MGYPLQVISSVSDHDRALQQLSAVAGNIQYMSSNPLAEGVFVYIRGPLNHPPELKTRPYGLSEK